MQVVVWSGSLCMQKRQIVVLPLVMNACVSSIAPLGKGSVRIAFPSLELLLNPGFFSFAPTNNQATGCISIYPWKPWEYFGNLETIMKNVPYKNEWWTR